MYVKAIRNLTGTVTPDTLAEQVAREIIDKEGLTLVEQPAGDEEASNEEWFNVGLLTFASLAEAMSYYLSTHEGTGLFCITLPIGNICLWDG